MNLSGTLKKRQRRVLVKVKGQYTIAYDENQDTFTGHELFQNCYTPQYTEPKPKPFTTRTQDDTRLQFSAKEMVEIRRESLKTSYSRVTRNPSFHCDPDLEADIQVLDEERCSSAAPSKIFDVGPFDVRMSVHPSLKNRAYFIDPTAITRLRQIIWCGVTSGSFPWSWNAKENRIDRWSPFWEKIWWIQWFLVTIQTTCIWIFQFFAFKNLIAGEHQTYREVFMGSGCLLWYSYTTLFNICFFFYKEKTRNYVNNMFRFNHEYVEKYLIHLDGYKDGGRGVINFATITNFSQILACIFFFVKMPYLPWYLFSYIHPKPWYWLIPGILQEYVMTGQVVAIYNLYSWIVVAHGNTTNFWLRETHKDNDTDYTSDELRNPKTALETYRTMQILCKIFNESISPMGLPVIKFAIFTNLLPCGYVLIRSMNQKFIDEFPAILTYPLGILDTSVAGFVILNTCAEVFDLGCGFIDSWCQTKQKDLRRILLSFPTLKTYVGSWYFITISTTITFFQICFGYITDCLLTFP